MTSKKTINDYRKLVPEQLAAEGELEYELFTAYCFLGIGDTRKLVKLVPYLVESSGLPEGGLDKYVARLKSWSAKFKWVDRAKKFDFRRVVNQADKLVVEAAKIDSEWVNKCRESREILQSILSDSANIREANKLLIEAAVNRLQTESKLEALVALNKIISGVVNTNFTLCRILSATWEVKENQEFLTSLQNEVIEFSVGEQL